MTVVMLNDPKYFVLSPIHPFPSKFDNPSKLFSTDTHVKKVGLLSLLYFKKKKNQRQIWYLLIAVSVTFIEFFFFSKLLL